MVVLLPLMATSALAAAVAVYGLLLARFVAVATDPAPRP